jgi:enoyl-CoA hydratase
MDYKAIIYKKEAGVATVILNRPEVLNALNQRLNQEITAVVDEIAKDRDVRVMIITGAGDKSFCTGRDLKEYGNYKLTSIEDWIRRLNNGAFFNILHLPQPVIAAVNGYALAGGMELALACDIIIAAENASFGMMEIRRGFFPGAGATWRLLPLVGKGWAMEMILSGDIISAQDAKDIGLVNHVVPQGKALSTSIELAKKIAKHSWPAVMLGKAAIIQSTEAYERNGYNLSTALRSLAETNPHILEGKRAFIEKREAIY